MHDSLPIDRVPAAAAPPAGSNGPPGPGRQNEAFIFAMVCAPGQGPSPLVCTEGRGL